MLLIGLEFDFGLSENKRTVVSVPLVGIIAPFTLGFALGRVMHDQLVGIVGSSLGFSPFMATAMSITAIPILGRIVILAFVTAIERSTLDPVKMANHGG